MFFPLAAHTLRRFSVATALVATLVGVPHESYGTPRRDKHESVMLTGIIRDFRERDEPGGHPDFEPERNGNRPTPGLVADQLDRSGKPVFTATPGSGSITSQDTFKHWFRDVKDVNRSDQFSIELVRSSESHVFRYDHRNDPRLRSARGFFPINGKLFGNSRQLDRNQHFTFELTADFEYAKGKDQFLNLTTDDDCWVFADRRLALDLGGLHSAASGRLEFDQLGWLQHGKRYRLHFFFAERMRTESEFTIETNVKLIPVRPCPCESKTKPKPPVVKKPEPARLQVVFLAEDGRTLPRSMLPHVEFVLDSSHSMARPLTDDPQTSRLQAVRRAVRTIVDSMSANAQPGLRLYGHWGIWRGRRADENAAAIPVGDPRLAEDSELVVPFGPLSGKQRNHIRRWLDWTGPRGETPLVESLKRALLDLPQDSRTPSTIVLFSDGRESCGGNTDELVKAMATRENVTVHIVAVESDDEESRQRLTTIAKAGRGTMFDLKDVDGLPALLSAATDRLEFEVLDGDGKIVGRGEVNGNPLDLPPGKYGVRLRSETDQAAGEATIEAKAGEPLRLEVNESGQLMRLLESGEE